MTDRIFAPRASPLWRKVAALLLVAAVLPVLLLSGVMLRRERIVIREARIALLDARIDEVGHTLEAIYRGYRDDAARAARDADVIEFCSLGRDDRAGLAASTARLLDLFRSEDPALSGVAIVDRSGEVIAATERDLIGVSVVRQEYVRRALTMGPVVSDIFVGLPAVGRTATVAFAAPIRTQAGDVIGAYLLWLRAEALWEVMRAANGTAGAGSFFTLLDRNGFRVGHSRDDRLLFHPTLPIADDVSRAMLSEQRFGERTAELMDAVVPFPFDQVKGQARAMFLRRASTTTGVDNLAVAHHYDGLDATLIGQVPATEVNVGVATLIPRVLPAFLLGLVLAVVGSALVIRHVVWPLRRVSAAAFALERGELDFDSWERLETDTPQQDEVGGLARAFTSMARALGERDRTLRQRNRDLERKQRALATLTACNEALVRASDEAALLQAVCDVIVRDGGYLMCWIGFAEDDERKTVRTVARAGHDEGYISAADIVWADEERGSGPVGRAIRTGKPIALRDLASEPSVARWMPEARRRGFASMAAVPIVSEGGVRLGALAIYAAEVGAFGEDDMALLGDLAADVAYGVIALRGRSERLEMAARLLQADRMVAVGTLAAGVAHEINNPLAYALSAVEFQREELVQLERELPAGRLDELKAACADARDGVKRVSNIVRDLKTFSRADEGSRGAVDLHDVIDSAVNMAMNEIRHRARLVKRYGTVPPVDGNESRLGQVFLNLLVNAAQAIPEGRADENEVTISTETDESSRVVVEVRDTGTGIDPAIVRHVFDPFFTTKPLGVGTGLGLFVCHNIIHASGGEITIRSVPGEGTVVRVVLLAASSQPLPLSAAAQAEPRLGVGRRGRVLVVDDEPAVGYAIRRLLQKEHDVAALTSAGEARDRLARGERFDAILCDLMMPMMSGIELYEGVLALDPSQAARFVLLTGGAFTPQAVEFVERWPHSRLEKPVDADDLRTVVTELVARA